MITGDVQTNRCGKHKAILGPAGPCKLCIWLSGW